MSFIAVFLTGLYLIRRICQSPACQGRTSHRRACHKHASLMGVPLTGVYLIRRVSHGCASHGRASYGCAPMPLHLCGMRLMGVHLMGVRLMGVHLWACIHSRASLTGVYLIGVCFRLSDFSI
jgi:uncharacterized protein YjbI with pentapeptide repeats